MIGVGKYYDKKPVLKDIYLSYFYGAKIGVLGLNGSGKSSLLRILAGRDKEFNGETVLSPGYSVGFLEQEPELDDNKTVREIVEEGVHEIVSALNEYNLINEKFAEPMSDDEMNKLIERQGKVQEKLDSLDAWDLDARLDMAMDALRCPPGDTPVKVLSGGERREEKAESERQRTLQRELEWIQMSPKGRHAKSKARISSYEALLAQDVDKSSKDLEIYIPPGPRLGDVVIEADNVSKAYGDNILMEGMTFSLPPGGIIGVIGPNGAGKTTLFRMITGQEKPDSGIIRIGETVKPAYVDQSRDTLDPGKTIWEVISGGDDTIELGKRQVNSRAYVARFNFSGADQQKRVSMLSGGERNRVHLAGLLKEGANVLLLDEPTNDLDVNTMRALEEALENFAGCAVVISHDRWFLDRIATHILAFEGESRVVWFDGNFSEYEADRSARLGSAADQPHRIKYRHLTRG